MLRQDTASVCTAPKSSAFVSSSSIEDISAGRIPVFLLSLNTLYSHETIVPIQTIQCLQLLQADQRVIFRHFIMR